MKDLSLLDSFISKFLYLLPKNDKIDSINRFGSQDKSSKIRTILSTPISNELIIFSIEIEKNSEEKNLNFFFFFLE